MAAYQATSGQRLFTASAYSMATRTEIPGVTQTPDKGGSPSEVSLNIISERFQRSLAGQQEMPSFEYNFAPDFTASIGNMAIIGGLVDGTYWFYEEYETPADSDDLGSGILYKGKVVSMYAGGQQGNNAQSASFSVNLVSKSIYIATAGTGTMTYVDMFTGETVVTPE